MRPKLTALLVMLVACNGAGGSCVRSCSPHSKIAFVSTTGATVAGSTVSGEVSAAGFPDAVTVPPGYAPRFASGASVSPDDQAPADRTVNVISVSPRPGEPAAYDQGPDQTPALSSAPAQAAYSSSSQESQEETPQDETAESRPQSDGGAAGQSSRQASARMPQDASAPSAGEPSNEQPQQAEQQQVASAPQITFYPMPYPVTVPYAAEAVPPPSAVTQTSSTDNATATVPVGRAPAIPPPRYELGPSLQGYTSPTLAPPGVGVYAPGSRYPTGR